MLTLREAAAELGLAPSTLRAQIRSGALAAVKVGHIWAVTEAEVDRYRARFLGRVFGQDHK